MRCHSYLKVRAFWHFAQQPYFMFLIEWFAVWSKVVCDIDSWLIGHLPSKFMKATLQPTFCALDGEVVYSYGNRRADTASLYEYRNVRIFLIMI